MDACVSVEREVDKVFAKFHQIGAHSQRTLGDLIHHVEEIRNELKEVSADSETSAAQSLILTRCLQKVKDSVTCIGTNHKDLHSSVSKVGKAIDRNFMPDINALGQESKFETPEKIHLINEVVCEHFFRKGMLDIAEQLIHDAGLQVDGTNKEPFIEINKILEALKRRNLLPALQWAQLHRQQLQSQNSSLEFKLHRLQFIELLRSNTANQQEILLYARNFAIFADAHAKDNVDTNMSQKCLQNRRQGTLARRKSTTHGACLHLKGSVTIEEEFPLNTKMRKRKTLIPVIYLGIASLCQEEVENWNSN
ncbi:E3 ubiquitin-protein ligase RMND5A-like [Saccoglossus kowalevskii]|uniref:Protein RMD5 homolog A-like n=1 Tax=Saccoglossus kowalevskii TaxID=10224 RepID=A0ABM0H0L1_SACKO|nr:PREDICTED: protein RMD5 homolog A-like [Saccoglossus kowalevskii]